MRIALPSPAQQSSWRRACPRAFSKTSREAKARLRPFSSELTPYSRRGNDDRYAGTAPRPSASVIDHDSEFRALKESPVTEEELRRSKKSSQGFADAFARNPPARACPISHARTVFRRFYSLDEILTGIEAVTTTNSSCPAFVPGGPNRRPPSSAPEWFTLDRSRLAC